jgi:copper resistance protein B
MRGTMSMGTEPMTRLVLSGVRRALRATSSILARAAIVALISSAPALRAQAPEMHPPRHEMTWGRATFALAEVLELLPDAEARPLHFDLVGWHGGPVHRLWVAAEGSAATRGSRHAGSYEAAYGRAVSPFWDFLVGARAEVASGGGARETRAGLVLGVQGLAPGWFELEPTLFVDADGALSADLTASYDLYVTQRLVLQPRGELAAAARDLPAFGVGRGLSEGSLALRLRWEVRPEFAPYVGVVAERKLGRTADLARGAGAETGETQVVLGLRLWR